MATPTTLPGDFSPGQVLTAANMDDLRGAFRILQVVYGSDSAQVINSTNVYADTGLTATITPQATSSKILVVLCQNGCSKEAGNASSYLLVQLLRNSTVIGTFSGGATGVSQANKFGSIAATVLDTPTTTSAITYKTQFKNEENAASVRIGTLTSLSTLILMEVSA
jgi:hypothetical protein